MDNVARDGPLWSSVVHNGPLLNIVVRYGSLREGAMRKWLSPSATPERTKGGVMGDMGEVDVLEVMDSEDGLAYWAMRAYRCTLRMSEGERREERREEKKREKGGYNSYSYNLLFIIEDGH